jgi:hypothetical protein
MPLTQTREPWTGRPVRAAQIGVPNERIARFFDQAATSKPRGHAERAPRGERPCPLPSRSQRPRWNSTRQDS